MAVSPSKAGIGESRIGAATFVDGYGLQATKLDVDPSRITVYKSLVPAPRA